MRSILWKPFPVVAQGALKRVDFYTSHEALHLHYEQALTREVPRQKGWFNLTTHFPWIGMRTADVDGAHIEYFKGIRNPVGIKVGPAADAGQLQQMLKILNPESEKGRMVLIHRMGATQIESKLPPLIRAVQDTGSPVLWVCDPMHGNTESTASGLKTRRFRNIMRRDRNGHRIASSAQLSPRWRAPGIDR